MEHERARELFVSLHDGDLAPAEKAELEEHLAGCEECRREWEAYKLTLDGISGLYQLPPPEGLTKAVEQKIRKRSRGRFFGPQRSLSTQFALVGFILVLLFMLAYLVMAATTEITVLEKDSDAKAASGAATDAGAKSDPEPRP